MAAKTTTLRFTPFVLKLPVRPPVLVAKEAASVAYLSGNRLGLGIGLSPWPEDFLAMGVPWERRGKRMDECIDIVRGLTTGEFFSYDGEFYHRRRGSRCWSVATPMRRCGAPYGRATAGCMPAATVRSLICC